MREFKSNLIPLPPLSIHWDLIPKNKKQALEIGAGNGLFSLSFTNRNKDWFLISLERTAEKAAAFHKKKKAFPNANENLLFLRADAVNVVTHLIKPDSLDKIFLLYPNPYVKSKHENLRWHNMVFFPELLSKLKKRGRLELRTNLEWYARDFEEKMRDVFKLELLVKEVLDKKHTPETAFEKKYLARGEKCFRLIFSYK